MQWRGSATKQVADVIQTIQLVQKTGILKLERGDAGTRLQEGTITFVNGQITDAQVEHLRGTVALNHLLAWSTCRFTFLPAAATISSPPPSGNTALVPYNNNNGSAQNQRAASAPHRLRKVEAVLPLFTKLGLTRTHRHLFLLIDGQRTLTELTQLLGRHPNEVYALLSDLARAGLIQL